MKLHSSNESSPHAGTFMMPKFLKFIHCALEQRCWRVKMLGGRTMQREGDTCRQRHEYEIALRLKVET